jgi:site-specific DNA-methyltransferase (adenine-specific)
MNKEAASAGFYVPENFPRMKCPRVQILTIEELLEGKQVSYPRLAPAGTFKAAEPKPKAGKNPTRLF